MVPDWQAEQEEKRKWMQGKRVRTWQFFGQRANFCYPGFGQIVKKFVSSFNFYDTPKLPMEQQRWMDQPKFVSCLFSLNYKTILPQPGLINDTRATSV